MRLMVFGGGFPTLVDPKKLAMPTEQGVGLHNMQGLLPETGKSGQDYQAKTIVIGQPWALYLAIEDNQLLAQHGIFNQEISPAAGQVC